MPGTPHGAIARARQALTAAGLTVSDAAVDAEVLARHVLGWDRTALLVHGREPATAAFLRDYEAAIARRTAREPVAFITGRREFWGRDFEVTRDVLVPRPETELVVDVALRELRDSRPLRILDVGTGSGCLAVTLAAELPNAYVVASDVSRPALDVARRNATRHGVGPRVACLVANLLDPIVGPLDVIVSNPPYVPIGAELPPEVEHYEPPAALFAGADGLDAIRTLVSTARAVLAGHGLFVVEFGFGQSDALRAMARASGWTRVELHNDLQGIPRVAVMVA
jgi:release factor glutamine methyltransferase